MTEQVKIDEARKACKALLDLWNLTPDDGKRYWIIAGFWLGIAHADKDLKHYAEVALDTGRYDLLV